MNQFWVNVGMLTAVLCLLAIFLLILRFKHTRTSNSLRLHKFPGNPLLSPQRGVDWETCGVFNPAAYKDDEGVVHLLYRAIGADGVSRLGYAKSSDGVSLDDRSDHPVFAISNPRSIDGGYRYDPLRFPSGGSWGGCEDPRLVKIDERLYMTFNAFDGWDFIRIAVTSINEQDFLNGRWIWKKPMLLSPDGEIHKNWVLFPEKINGKFAILHSISPHMQIDYVDHLEDLAQGRRSIKSIFRRQGDRTEWDTWLRGAGCPPIKTDKGWLVLYHAVEKHEKDKYKIGALLLDVSDPRKVIARGPGPILTPECWYENDGKPGIVYVCGAVIKDKKLFVYYGGGDRHTCVAQVGIEDLLKWLIYTT